MNHALAYLEAARKRLDLAAHGLAGAPSCVVLTPRFRASSHVVFLLLDPTGVPRLVAKVPRLPDHAGPLEREAANLERLARAPRLHGSVPRLVAFERWRGRALLLETALVGRPLDRPTVRRDPDRACRAALAWLEALPRDTAPAGSDRSRHTAWVEEPLRALETRLAATPEERDALARSRALLAPLRDLALPGVVEHGDLSYPNLLLLADGRLGVVDWELAEPDGPPLSDLCFFLAYVAFARGRAGATRDYVRHLHEAFLGPRPWAMPFLRTHAAAQGLPAEALPALFVLAWLRTVARIVDRLGAPGARLPDATAAWLRENRYHAIWRHVVEQAPGMRIEGDGVHGAELAA